MAQRQRRDDDLDIPPLANAVFAGEEAAQNLARQGITGPANAIALARSLRAQGVKNPKEIHARTSELLRGTPYAGVHFTADGTPRFEITDHSAKMRKGALGSSGKAYLGDVLDHPELYRAVPGSSLPTVQVSRDGNSSYTPGAQEIEIGQKHTARLGKTTVLKETAKGPLLHETQHVVQELHGLSPGSSPDDFRKLYPGTDEVAREKRRIAYTLTAGEQEAEATRIRQNLTAEERRWRPATEDMEPVKAHRRVPVETGRQMQFGGDLPKGYSVTRKSDADLARYNATEYTIRHNGNDVGTAFVTDIGDKVKVSKIDIAASHTRKGIGTALYGQIERDFGKPLAPDDHLSPKAHAFWQKHRPEALKDHRVLKSGNAVRDPHGYLASEYATPGKQMFLDDLADRAVDAWKRATTREVVEGRPIHQRRLDPRRVAADPETFQFKSGGDNAGVTDRLKGVKEWDPLAAGKQIVYQRANGDYVIADGHQRRGLALRALEAGQKDVALDAYVLREKDGWSPRDVRAYAALKNMKESSGNALDMAQVLRERPDLAGKSLPMSDAKIRDAVALSKLSPKAFDMVVSGVIKPEHAAPVGSAIGDNSRHADMLTEMAKAGMRSAEHARLYVQQALAAPSLTETTGSLFGEETTTRSLLAERAKVLDRALGQLKSDKRIFALLEREAANIESVGNRLAHGANLEQADTAGRLAELVERLSTTRGPVSEMLDKAAIAMAEGKSPAQAARGFVGDVGKTMKGGGINALTGDAPAPMPALIDPNQGSMFGEPGKPAGWSDEARAASAEVRKGKAKGKQSKARGRKQMMIEDGSPKPPKDIRPEFSKGQFMLADAGRSIDFSQGWKAAKAGRALPPGANPDFAAGFQQYRIDKSPRAAERAMVQHLAKGGDVHILGNNTITLAGTTMPEKGKPANVATVDGQKGMQQAADAAVRNRMTQYAEMQRSGNPLTDAERTALADKRPEYEFMRPKSVPKGEQTSFLPDATTKEQIAAAAKAAGKPTVAQQPMDDGMFGSGMNQTDLVEMAKAKQSLPAPSAVDKSASWVESLPEASRKQVFSAMRTVDAEAQKSYNIEGRRSGIEVGSADFDRTIKGAAYESFLREIRKGATPDAAEATASVEVRKIVETHNSRRTGDVNWARDAEFGQQHVQAAKMAVSTAVDVGPKSNPKGSKDLAFPSSMTTPAPRVADRHAAALTQTENTGKPSGWSDEARDASAHVRKENAVGKSRKQSKAQVEKAAARENYRRVMGSDAPAKMTTAQLRKAAPANAPSKSDPFAVKLVPTAQREGPQGLAKALSGMTAQDLRTAAKAQGIHVPANRKTTESVREYVARATFGKIADRVAAAGGDQAPYIHMAAEAANHLRGTQNPENMKAIVANKKAKAKGKASSGAAEANAALAARKESLRGKSKASGADVIKALGDGRKGRGRKQSFVDDGTARPALPSTAKPSLASRAGRAFNVAGTAGLVAGVGAAAVMAANESAAKGESVGKQVAAGATAAGVAAAPAVAVGGAMAAAAKWGGATVAKAVPVVGWGIAGAAAVHGAVTAGREAAKDGKGAGGVAKAAAWGAVNSVVPIDAAMQAARSVRARMSSGPQRLSPEQAGQYAQANDSFQRQQALNTTQTDTPSTRKPGWSPEARVAAAKARGAINLPYGGDPSKAPGFTMPKAS